MARGPASQRTYAQPSQSQRRTLHPTQTQRPPQRPADTDDESEEESEESDDANANNAVNGHADGLERLANSLVRLALFNECKRMPLRREDINKRVLGQRTRQFNVVLALANENLRSAFGTELVELQSRAERTKVQNESGEAREDATATGLKKKATSTGSKSYILRSTLDSRIIELAARTDEELLEEEILEVPEDEDDDEIPRSYGSIISWSTSDQLGAIGLLYVILALILVNGHVLSDMDLRKHLRTFRLPIGAQVEFTRHSTHRSMPVENYLATLIRQGYLDKVKVNVAGGPRPTQGKRGRAATDKDEEGLSYEWTWGSRAQAEIGELAIAQFVGEFVVERILKARTEMESETDEGTPAERRVNGHATNGRRRQRKDNPDELKDKLLADMMKGIARVAGGKLNDVK